MALKGDRDVLMTDISFHMNMVGEAGNIAVFSTGGSGAALDQGEALVEIATDPSGSVPAGLLQGDMVDIDQTRQIVNPFKDETQKGGKVSLGRKGWWVTNRVTGTPSIGDVAYLGASGQVTPTVDADGGIAATPVVGKFLSTVDEDGYVKVQVDLG